MRGGWVQGWVQWACSWRGVRGGGRRGSMERADGAEAAGLIRGEGWRGRSQRTVCLVLIFFRSSKSSCERQHIGTRGLDIAADGRSCLVPADTPEGGVRGAAGQWRPFAAGGAPSWLSQAPAQSPRCSGYAHRPRSASPSAHSTCARGLAALTRQRGREARSPKPWRSRARSNGAC